MDDRNSRGQDQVRKTKKTTRENKWEVEETPGGSGRLGVVLHCSTVQLQLHKHDLHGRGIRRKHLLQPDFLSKRTFRIHPEADREQRSVWRTKDTEFGKNNICPAVNHGGGGSMRLWGCVAGSGTISQVEGSDGITTNSGSNMRPSVKKLMLERGRLLHVVQKNTLDPPRPPQEAPAEALEQQPGRTEDFSEEGWRKIPPSNKGHGRLRKLGHWPRGGAVG